MKTKFTITLLLTLFALNSYLNAQPSASIYFTSAIPINDYRDFDNDAGYGGNLEFFFFSPTKQKPFGMGISLSYFGQGLYFYNDPFTDESYLGANRANNFANLQMIFQVAPSGGTVRPYFETFFGGSYIFSNTEILTVDYYSVNLYYDDWAWTYGAGAGIKFLIGGAEGYGSMFLDFKGRYMMSSDVTLLDRQSIRFANDTFYYSDVETQLNFFAIQAGLVFYFR